MTWSVYQHWDPLRVCVVGRSYPPEFYSWIKVPHVRSLFERIAIETEEDFQNIIKKLKEFGVEVLRPDLPVDTFVNGRFVPPPMTPRDYTVMIGERFFYSTRMENSVPDFKNFYNNVKDPSWPDCNSLSDFKQLPLFIQEECTSMHDFNSIFFNTTPIHRGCYDKIINRIQKENNIVVSTESGAINGAMVSRIGKDLYFGTSNYNSNQLDIKESFNKIFPDYRIHVVNTGGHVDGTYCPVAPGLIISLQDVPTYKETFPDWEVVYLPGQSWSLVSSFLQLKRKNGGKWWIPGFEHDQDVVDTVERWLTHWTGYVEETVFDVNMLIVNPKNVIVFNYNKTVFDALERYGITPHIVPFRHRYFWDGGIHCVTSDLCREGTMQDFFPNRS